MSADHEPGPSTIEEFEQLLQNFVSEDSVRRGVALQLRPTDVVISPFAKCGTTWLQQMVHTLRTGGDMDFDDISRVVPWIETSHDLGIPLDTDQRAQPRAFKSHLPSDPMPRGGRYLIALRAPDRALVSFLSIHERLAHRAWSDRARRLRQLVDRARSGSRLLDPLRLVVAAAGGSGHPGSRLRAHEREPTSARRARRGVHRHRRGTRS